MFRGAGSGAVPRTAPGSGHSRVRAHRQDRRPPPPTPGRRATARRTAGRVWCGEASTPGRRRPRASSSAAGSGFDAASAVPTGTPWRRLAIAEEDSPCRPTRLRRRRCRRTCCRTAPPPQLLVLARRRAGRGRPRPGPTACATPPPTWPRCAPRRRVLAARARPAPARRSRITSVWVAARAGRPRAGRVGGASSPPARQAGRRRGGHPAGGHRPGGRRPAARRRAVRRPWSRRARRRPPAGAGRPRRLIGGRPAADRGRDRTAGDARPARRSTSTAGSGHGGPLAAGLAPRWPVWSGRPATRRAAGRPTGCCRCCPSCAGCCPAGGLRRGSTIAVATGRPACAAAAHLAAAGPARRGVPGRLLVRGGRRARRWAWPPPPSSASPWTGWPWCRTPGPDWPTVVAALIDGVDVVVAAVPGAGRRRRSPAGSPPGPASAAACSSRSAVGRRRRDPAGGTRRLGGARPGPGPAAPPGGDHLRPGRGAPPPGPRRSRSGCPAGAVRRAAAVRPPDRRCRTRPGRRAGSPTRSAGRRTPVAVQPLAVVGG